MKNFRWQIVLRIVLTAVSVVATIFVFHYSRSYLATLMLAGAVIIQVGALVRYVDKTNRDLDRFLRSIRYSDFSQSFSGMGRGRSFEALARSFTEVMGDFRRIRADTEEQHRYLQTVMQHVGTGLISFEPDGTVGLVNNAAKRLFRVGYLKNIRSLESFSSELVDALHSINRKEKAIVQVVHDDEMMELVLIGTDFRLRGRKFTLVSIQNIQSELEEKEIEAWQKLTRVLTHEIMNSITPIASLASTVQEMLEDATLPDAVDERAEDLRSAVQTIERRSHGLLSFVQAYRSLTRIPRPNLQIFTVTDLFDGVVDLFRGECDQARIDLEASVEPKRLDLTADPELIEQVLINLIRNAIQSADGRTGIQIRIRAYIGNLGRPTIQVTDNGPGIEPEALDKIFIPFFSTKKDGSGIGLSLSRQIMRKHGGSMSAVSTPGRQTVFTLRF